jgi:hypothetical protein
MCCITAAVQVSDADGISVLRDAIHSHFQDAGVVASACGLLRHLAKSDVVKKWLSAATFLDDLERVLEEHKSNAKVCTQVCTLLMGSNAGSLPFTRSAAAA